MNDIQAIIDLIKQAQSAGGAGVFGVISVILYGIIKIYRLPLIQRFVPEKAKWENMPSLIKWGAVFCLSFAGSLLASVAAGTGWLAAIPGAIVAALGAMGLRSSEKVLLPEKKS